MTTITTSRSPLFADRPLYADDARGTLMSLETRLSSVLSQVDASEIWGTVVSPDTPRHLVTAILREIMWSVYQYQQRTTQAGFSMLGRLPKSEVKLLASLVHHKAEEAGHWGWARRDYLLLGGTTDGLDAPLSPATFAVAAVWDRLAAAEDPFGYLGAEYLFESLTMQVTQRVLPILRAKQVDHTRIGFITEHAVEDVRHTNLIVHWILDVATRHPGSGAHMLRAFDYFANVYPVAVWDEALQRAQRSGLQCPCA